MAERNIFVPRVNQIDAIQLNKSITRLIREHLVDNLQAISPALFARIQPEVDLLIHATIWFGSVRRTGANFGQQLLVLAYAPESLNGVRLFLHFVLSVVSNYARSVHERRSVRALNETIAWTNNITLVLSVLNFFRFLKTGRQPTLIDYLLGLDYISLRHNQRRDIGNKYLTRELLWGGFTEILGMVLPIINFRKLQRLFKSHVLGTSAKSLHFGLSDDRQIRALNFTATTLCCYCGERPTQPHHMGCGHVYCYYCLAANIATDAKFMCTSCDCQSRDGHIQAL